MILDFQGNTTDGNMGVQSNPGIPSSDIVALATPQFGGQEVVIQGGLGSANLNVTGQTDPPEDTA